MFALIFGILFISSMSFVGAGAYEQLKEVVEEPEYFDEPTELGEAASILEELGEAAISITDYEKCIEPAKKRLESASEKEKLQAKIDLDKAKIACRRVSEPMKEVVSQLPTEVYRSTEAAIEKGVTTTETIPLDILGYPPIEVEAPKGKVNMQLYPVGSKKYPEGKLVIISKNDGTEIKWKKENGKFEIIPLKKGSKFDLERGGEYAYVTCKESKCGDVEGEFRVSKGFLGLLEDKREYKFRMAVSAAAGAVRGKPILEPESEPEGTVAAAWNLRTRIRGLLGLG